MSAKDIAQRIFGKAGISINGSNPWDIQVHNEQTYQRVLAGGSIALGESYMDGWWDCKQLDVFFDRLLQAKLEKEVKGKVVLQAMKAMVLNPQSRGRSRKAVEHHYDIGNDLYEAMLDPTMAYSCGYWKQAKTLQAAQLAKYDLICRKLGLKKGMRILDIGCGWGGFLIYAAKNYGVSGVGVTLSKNQAELARKRARGLPIEIRLQDYRELNEQFDRIISVGMFEHVGPKNYRAFFEVSNRCLNKDGLLLLHTIGGNHSTQRFDAWMNKHIFPGAVLPSVAQIGAAAESLFVMEDWHTFGPDYDKTLMAWHANFLKAWPTLKDNYDDRFKRMWDYYLLCCAATFRARKNQLWQVVFSRGVPGGYTTVR